MRPAELDDSEGEVEEILCDDAPSTRYSSAEQPVDCLPAIDHTYDVHMPDQGTGSTERLRQDIRRAQQALGEDSADHTTLLSSNTMIQHLAASPSVQRSKRRHSERTDDVQSKSLGQALKRAKSSNVRSSGRSSAYHLASGSETFPSEHAAANRYSAAPTPSLRAEFLRHEPNPLFGHSGSTIPDNDSAQQLMLDHAAECHPTPHIQQSVVNSKTADSDATRSSSFPWTASEQTTSEESAKCTIEIEIARAAAKETNLAVSSESIAAVRAQSTQSSIAVKSHASPTVQLSVSEAHTTREQSSNADNLGRTPKGRKCNKTDSLSDPLNTESALLGAAAEIYVARPTRRRATQIPELPENYSVNPDKAAKAKRTKTSEASLPSNEPAVDSKRRASRKAHSRLEDKPADMIADGTSHCVPAARQSKDNGDQLVQETKIGTLATDTKNHEPDLQLGDREVISQASVSKESDGEIFVKSPTRPRKSKQSSKTKRSQTTIYEDHIAFQDTQRSPSLSQQQADRMTLLRDVKNGSHSEAPRKSLKVIRLTDDEDQSSFDIPRPAGRGGETAPTDCTGVSKARLANYDEDQTENDHPISRIDGAQDATTSEQRKKRGRGHRQKQPTPAAATPKTAGELQVQLPEERAAEKETLQEAAPSHSPQPPPSTPEDQTLAKEATAAQLPTPSPPQQDQNASTTMTASKSSPTTHSPLSISALRLRVGLSKRQRIPPLLKIMKPTKK